MNILPADLFSLAGYILSIVVAFAAYRFGFARGSRRAHHLWTEWTGITPTELVAREFDRALRRLRRDIGRPADSWPA
jgi:hypothetical protein